MNIRAIERKIRTPAIWALIISILVSLVSLVLYIIKSGQIDETDESLFFQLTLLRYSSFLICICSFYLLALGIYRIITRPSVMVVVQIILYLCSALYGTGIILIDTFILTITAGNG